MQLADLLSQHGEVLHEGSIAVGRGPESQEY